MLNFRIRLRLPTGSTVVTAPADSVKTYGDLLSLVSANIQTATTNITLKSGFPPTAITLKKEESINTTVRSGDTLVVTIGKPSPNRQAPQQPPPRQ